MCNDPRVGQYAFRRPYPYTPSDADWFFDNIHDPLTKPAIAPILAFIRPDNTSSSDQPTRDFPPLLAFPFGALRYVPQGDTSSDLEGLTFVPGQFVGNLHIFPYEKAGMTPEEMLGKPAVEQTWETAYDIIPELFGRGIGKALVGAGMAFVKWVGIGSVVAVSQER
jgi:RimJ/RimL family protein N-acetyltransferase